MGSKLGYHPPSEFLPLFFTPSSNRIILCVFISQFLCISLFLPSLLLREGGALFCPIPSSPLSSHLHPSLICLIRISLPFSSLPSYHDEYRSPSVINHGNPSGNQSTKSSFSRSFPSIFHPKLPSTGPCDQNKKQIEVI